MVRPIAPIRPLVVEQPLSIRIERASPSHPWMVRGMSAVGSVWPYLDLRAAAGDARRYLASHGGGELVVDDEGGITRTRVDGTDR